MMTSNTHTLIAATSDLHLDVPKNREAWSSDLLPPSWEDAHVLVLAGDIHQVNKGVAWVKQVVHKRFPNKPVVYVPGNHEGWSTSWQRAVRKMKEEAQDSSIYVLHNDQAVIDGVRFLGSTLWTDLKAWPDHKETLIDVHPRTRYDPGMRDYLHIRLEPSFRKLAPRDTMAMNTHAKQWLLDQASAPFDGPTVVVTHHPPIVQAAGPAYVLDGQLTGPLSAAYVNDWEDGLRQVNAELWIHGHTHHPHSVQIGGTFLLSHAVGHLDEELQNMSGMLIDVTKGKPACYHTPHTLKMHM